MTTPPTSEQEAAGRELHAKNPEGWPKPAPWEALNRERQLGYIRWAVQKANKAREST